MQQRYDGRGRQSTQRLGGPELLDRLRKAHACAVDDAARE
jgi:hypothetical protein